MTMRRTGASTSLLFLCLRLRGTMIFSTCVCTKTTITLLDNIQHAVYVCGCHYYTNFIGMEDQMEAIVATILSLGIMPVGADHTLR